MTGHWQSVRQTDTQTDRQAGTDRQRTTDGVDGQSDRQKQPENTGKEDLLTVFVP